MCRGAASARSSFELETCSSDGDEISRSRGTRRADPGGDGVDRRGADDGSRAQGVREPVRPLPWRRRQRRRNGAADSSSAFQPATTAQLATLIHEGIPLEGHAAERSLDDRSQPLSSRSCDRSSGGPRRRPWFGSRCRRPTGTMLDGQLMAEGFDDLQLMTDDKRRPPAAPRRRSGPRGDVGGRLAELQRRSRRQPLHDADADRQDQRRAAGAAMDVHAFPAPASLQGTPVVVGGIMYVTAPNECYALDAGSGRQIWQYRAAAHARASTQRAAPIAASPSPAIASSWRPTTRTSSR